MRSYIRHPSGMPISIRPDEKDEMDGGSSEKMNNISYGGLSFTSQAPLIPGAMVSLSVSIPHGEVESRGRVSWCRERVDGYEIGVEFLDAGDFYTVRMVEQVCHIENYRGEELKQKGRSLSCAQAAEEWIDKYAADFPSTFPEQPKPH